MTSEATSPAQSNTPDGRVVIPASVYMALEAIRRSGVVNMLDRKGVQYVAHRRNFYAAVGWLEDNVKAYGAGFVKGFAPDRVLTDDEQDAIEVEGSL